MAIKTINFLPSVLQTDTNQKFLNATLDQLVSQPDLRKINAFVGRRFAPTFKSTDNYQPEPTTQRQNYQLEPSVVVRNSTGNVDFFSSYIDLLNQLDHDGAITNDQSRMFTNETYSFDGLFDFDKFVNFNEYYWLPDGPDSVEVYSGTVPTERTYTVTRDPANGYYTISGYGDQANPTLKLAHGGVYKFIVDQPGFPFWLQSFPGVSGVRPLQKNLTTRSVLGVDNNGTDRGTITFTVPKTTAQDYYTRMPTAATVDFSTDLSYAQLQGQLLSNLVNNYNGIDHVTSQLKNKVLIFVNQEIDDVQWTVTSNVSSINTPIDSSLVVPVAQRRGAWKITLAPLGSDYIITLVPDVQVATNQKVYVIGGTARGEMTYYLDPDSMTFLAMPDITATALNLYYQDGVTDTMVGTMDMVDVSNSTINVDSEIVGKKNYLSPNGVTLTNGLKITFDTTALPVTYQGNTYYVEGVGSAIRLLPVTNYLTPESYAAGGLSTPDYMTINRSSLDLNAWSRSNRWFHTDVILSTAGYNNTLPLLDQNSRARRPIIEFDADTQLFQYGSVAKKPVDVIDFVTTDAFNSIELHSAYPTIDGVTVFDGMRVIFANDFDPNVVNQIYVLGISVINGSNKVTLAPAADATVVANNNLVVLSGTSAGKEFRFDGSAWHQCQAKNSVNQSPLFDIFDSSGHSIGDTTWYPASTFIGTKIFSYTVGTGTADTVLGFPLSYRNFNQIGDIQFTNNYDLDTFGYTGHSAQPINAYLLHKNNSITDFNVRNIWVTNSEKSRQFQVIQQTYDGTTATSYIKIDITPTSVGLVPYLRVYKNSRQLASDLYAQVTVGANTYIHITDGTLASGDHIDVLIYSQSVSNIGYYEIPQNLNLNTENATFTSLTLGQMRNHLTTMVANSDRIVGTVPGDSNLRDVPIKQQGGSIIQNASPVLYSELFLVDPNVNFLKGLDLARHEYAVFKNKFLEMSINEPGLNINDIPGSTDLLLKKINAVKNNTFPWYYSDMVPYGDARVATSYAIVNAEIRDYELTQIFNDTVLGNTAVLIYINNVQLVRGRDYTFDTTRAGFTFANDYPLNAGDTLTIYEYSNTDGNFIPETPTKLGLYPKFTPQIYTDNSYLTPIQVIQGHDGSITPAFGDYRDDLLLEFEKRIYNNIKVSYAKDVESIYDFLPGKFRIQDYSLAQFNQLLSGAFLAWVGGNRVDFTTNTYFQAGDPFTWNFARFRDNVTGEILPGTWRAIYKYFYDTDRPDICPWEMLGFSEQPQWWATRYGPAPYTGGNLVLWRDLAAGYVWNGGGTAAYTDSRFIRPGLTDFIPVDEYGLLRSPDQFLVQAFNSNDANSSFAVGNQGPVETAWRRSSDYPFAVQRALALSRPAYYFGTLMNVVRYYKNTDLNQYVLADTLQRITPTELDINGDTTNGVIVRSAGYLNWIAEYLRNIGINPNVTINNYQTNVKIQLAYKMAGFSDKSFLEVIAEQSSPSSTNGGVVIPNENYQLIVQKSTPTATIIYSAVIVEKSSNGYTVSGYDLNNPYFTIIPSLANNNTYGIQVNNDVGVVYQDFQSYTIRVPYGFEFNNKQQVVDFLVSYERYLKGMGLVFEDFDGDMQVQRDWKLSIREFLSWSQQGWKNNNVIILSPVFNKLTVNLAQGVVDEIVNAPNASRVLDTNFAYIKKSQFSVYRTDNVFSITSNYGQTISMASLDVVEYEHAIIFDNITVFNDVIYVPELGNRQYRLKLVGNKTGSWTGVMNPAGFIYNNNTIDAWTAGRDYAMGSLVSYKGIYYSALADIPATMDFVITDWTQIPTAQIKTGMLPNFSYNAQRFNNLFDLDNPETTMGMEKFSQAMIGFSERQYMTDFGINLTTQAKFYQGFIKEKGSLNSVQAFTAAGFNGVTSTINMYEEWGMRVGEYGALENNQYVELQLPEDLFTGDPATFTLLPNGGSASSGIIGVTPDMLYKKSSGYTPDIFNDRDGSSDYTNDIRTAGYVNVNDVDTTIFNIGDYASLNAVLPQVVIGYKIWNATSATGGWNIYRVTETNTNVISMAYNIDNVALVTTRQDPRVASGDYIVIKDFDSRFDGFYQVYEVKSNNSFTIVLSGPALTELKAAQTATGNAPLYRLASSRLSVDTDINTLTPPLLWRDNDKFWVDNVGDGSWAVYNKSTPWTATNNYSTSMTLASNTYVSNSGFGSALAIGYNSTFAAAGLPTVNLGNVAVFVSNISNGNVLTQVGNIGAIYSNISLFGSSIDIQGNLLYIGNPGNGTTESGRIHIHQFDGNTSFPWRQSITSPWSSNVGDQFGYSISASADNKWLFVGAPNAGNVYVYTANANSYYTYANTITNGSWANVEFGSAIKTSSDGSQTVIGAPYETVNGVTAAGAAYVYDRSIEKFTASGLATFNTYNPVTTSVVVRVNGVVQTTGYTTTTSSVTFTNAPVAGTEITIETNKFQQLQHLTATSPISGAQFGSAVTISGTDSDIYVSSPGYSESGYHSGIVYRFVNSGDRYGVVTSTVTNPNITIGDSIRVNGHLVTFSNVYLANVVSAINSANIAGITAVTTVYNTLVINSNITNSVQRLVLTPGNNSNVLANLGISVLNNVQYIKHIGTEDVNGFGSALATNPSGNALIISGPGSTTYNNMTIDTDSTTLDTGSTVFLDPVTGSGAVYVYGLVSGALSGAAPDQMVFVQRLQNNNLSANDKFGTSIASGHDTLLVGAPGDDNSILAVDPTSGTFTYGVNTGRVYTYNNFAGNVGWDITSNSGPVVDIGSVTSMYLYNSTTGVKLVDLDYIDPAKGKILGVAEQDIDFWTAYDPASYNVANSTDYVSNDVTVILDSPWGATQVGKTWWNLDLVRFLDYEQGTLNYRATKWGSTFPGSKIQVAEWVVSDTLPANYTGDGTVLYPSNNPAYVTETYVDPTSKIVRTRYYFWVIGKTSVPDGISRLNSTSTLEDIISNPVAQGIPYVAAIRADSVALYNVSDRLSGNTTVLHMDFDYLKNTNIIHSEYQLVKEGDVNSTIPERIVNKLRDSLAGIDNYGNAIPDPDLSPQTAVGLERQQSIFVDRLLAVENWVQYVNSILITTPVVNEFVIQNLFSAEALPGPELYDLTVSSHEQLSYINPVDINTQTVVLVTSDETQSGIWALYQSTGTVDSSGYPIYTLIRSQSYYTPFYWSYADWYQYSYDYSQKPTYQVATPADVQKLTLAAGDTVKILNNGNGQWEIHSIDSTLTSTTVGIQNGTVQLNSNLYSGTAISQFEIRVLFDTLMNNIFIGNLSGQFNKMFFFLVNYILSEQQQVDWVFKTSFVSILHQLRKLEQFPNYISDNQTYYESYINEVKPYRTTLREYLLDYQGTDTYQHNVTDFDVPSTYDGDLGIYRSPDLTRTADVALVSTSPLYQPWYNNYTYGIGTVDVVNGGQTTTVSLTSLVVHNSNATVMAGDYITQPSTGANGRAYINGIGSVIQLQPVSGQFTNVVETAQLDANATVWVGNIITQLSSGATANIVVSGTGNVITLSNVHGMFTTSATGNSYIYRDDGANLAAQISSIISIDPAYLYRNGANLMVNVDSVIYETIQSGGYFQEPSVTVVGGGGTGANIVAVINSTTNTISGFTVIEPGTGFTSVPTIYINGSGVGAVAYPHLVGKHFVQAIPTTQLTLGSNITAYAGNIIFQPNAASEGTVYADVINSNVVTLTDVVGNFNAANWIYTATSNLNSKVTAVNSYTNYVDQSYNVVRGFSSNIKFDRVSYTSNIVDWVSNATITANTVVRYNNQPYVALANVYPVTTLKLNGNITANVGDYITQAGVNGNAQVLANVTSGNVVTVGNLAGYYQRRGGNITINSNVTQVRPVAVTNVFDYSKYSLLSASSFDNANDRIMAYYTPTMGMPARDLNQLVPGLEYPGVQVQGTTYESITSSITTNLVSYMHSNFSLISSNISSLDFTTTEYATGQYITVSNLDLTTPDPLKFKIVNIAPTTMKLMEVSGNVFNITANSNVAISYYDFNNPADLDSSIQSRYLDSALGIRPEDINIDGGAYYDTFSSHAPEELIPGQTFDHLNMSVYTKILSNTAVIGYRIVGNAAMKPTGTDVGLWPQYYKIANTTVLTANLNLTDSTMSVANAAALPCPNLTLLSPGVVYVNGERITYYRNLAYETATGWTANAVLATGSYISYLGNLYLTTGNVYGNAFANVTANVTAVTANTLAQLRRGTDRTGAAMVHAVGSNVEPVNSSLLLPSTDNGTGNVHLGTWLNLNILNQAFYITDETGNTLVDESNEYILTDYNANSTLLGDGLEGSTTAQALFLKGS